MQYRIQECIRISDKELRHQVATFHNDQWIEVYEKEHGDCIFDTEKEAEAKIKELRQI